MSDLIKRKDVIDALVNLTCYGIEEIENLCNASVADAEGWLGGIKEAIDEIKLIPSAEPEPKWISTADRLPENNQRVLVSIIRSDGAKRVRTGSYSSNEYFWVDNGDYWRAKEVQAWMPLPEPWRGDE